MDAFAASPERPVLVQWLLDTRYLWPEATQTRQLETVASRAFKVLLTDEDRAAVLRYFHVRDAKMALASRLLKHLAVARCARVGWDRTRLTRDARSKPQYVAEDQTRPVAFNVSHQAGLVVLAAVYGGEARHGADVGGFFDVGVDVVSPSERRGRDHQVVADEGGWGRFVDMHADVFAAGEVAYLKHQVLSTVSPDLLPRRASAAPPMSASSLTPGLGPRSLAAPVGSVAAAASATVLPGPAADLLDLKLRCFYTLWCLREAYVKMTGEALLAPWLGELEFRRFQPPPRLPLPRSPASFTTDLRQDAAATVTKHDIQLHGRAVANANVCLRALGDDYMVCTAICTPKDPAVALGLEIEPFEVLSLRDVLEFADCYRGEMDREDED